VASWQHSRKVIREALDIASESGFAVVSTAGHGHSWGYVECPRCAQRHPVASTPKNDDNDKRRILAFIRRHERAHA
jgi:hypothetical protein